MKTHTWIWAIVMVGLGVVVGSPMGWAQVDGPDPAPESSSVVEEAAPVEAASEEEASASPESAAASSPAPAAAGQAALISVDFKDADIRQVLRIISLKSGVDIVAGADVEGLVTIKLTNVPWEEALDIILRTYGFTYERKGNIVRVLTVDAIEREALATEVFPLNYATAKEVPDVIKEMLSERGRVKFDERTNTIIVTDIPSNLFQIKTVIERLDQRTPQVLIMTKIVETRLSKDENLGIDWENVLNYSVTQTIPDIDNTFPFKAGSSLGSPGRFFGTDRAATRTGQAVDIGTLGLENLSLTLNYLQKRTDTKILSNPTISVLNNQEAKIHVGQEYPIPNYSIDPTTGNTTISGYTAKDTGTVLTVTPHVNPSAEIVVDLKPEIVTADSTGISYQTGTGTSVSLPLFTIQTAETQVRIQSGETIAIGGLVKTSEQHIDTKVPLLGDIPIVGTLFRNNRWYSGGSDPNKQDLLIFLTVTLQNDERKKEAAAVAAAPAEGSYP